MQGHIRSAVPRSVVAAKAIVERCVKKRLDAGHLVPPDPDGENDRSAAFAQATVTEYQRATGASDVDALFGLLTCLMHLCDRRDTELGWNFEQVVQASRQIHKEETVESKEQSNGPNE